jgi:hypothetical protein
MDAPQRLSSALFVSAALIAVATILLIIFSGDTTPFKIVMALVTAAGAGLLLAVGWIVRA